MVIQDLIREGSKKLEQAGLEDAKHIAKVLLAFLLKESISYLLIYNDLNLSDSIVQEYNESIKKLEDGIPIQYITNKQNFMGIDFFVNENVLIPRSDTEILVEEVISIAGKDKYVNILDMCTGSGAIAIALAKHIPNANIIATDISDEALKIAKLNAKNAKVNIEFKKSDIFENIDGTYDIIVSNPPYIKTKVIETLSKEVKNEPIIALDGGDDGLVFYRKIAKNARKHLKTGGYLAVEIGFDQKEEVKEIFKSEDYIEIYSKKDYGNNDRIIIGKIV